MSLEQYKKIVKDGADVAALMAEVARLRSVLRTEAEYCYGYERALTPVDPERAARHKARGDRLMAAIEGGGV